MFNVLYKHLIQYKSLALPGLGTLELQKIPAISVFTDHVILPPSYKIILDDSKDTPSKSLFQYISAQTGLNEWEAIKQLNDFSFDIKNRLKQGENIVWNKVGVLSMQDNGVAVLDSPKIEYEFTEAVPAIRVIRNNINHTILRGDVEVSERFIKEDEIELAVIQENRKWWLWASILASIALLLIFLYLYNNSFELSHFFNSTKPVIKEAPATYK